MADHHERLLMSNAEKLADMAFTASLVAANMCSFAGHVTLPSYRTKAECDLDRAYASLQRCMDAIDEVRATLRPETVLSQAEAAE